MPIEYYDTLRPRPRAGKRILKGKLLRYLGATGVLQPYTQNPERIIERKILLQNANVGHSLVTDQLAGAWESSDFDSIPNGNSITQWFDKSGNGHHWTLNPSIPGCSGGVVSVAPQVDVANTLGGHNTVSIWTDGNGNSPQVTGLFQPSFLAPSGYTGLEVMCIYKLANDPPLSLGAGTYNQKCFGAPFTFNRFPNADSHYPFSDGNFYTFFARTDRPNLGNPANSVATQFRLLNLSARADGTNYDAWVDAEHFHNDNTYTYTSAGVETCGYGMGCEPFQISVNAFQMFGNIAAIYLWTKTLNAAEKITMHLYLKSVWGTSFGF